MAAEAAIGKQRADLAIEVDTAGGGWYLLGCAEGLGFSGSPVLGFSVRTKNLRT